MKYGMNLLLWTTDVNESHDRLLGQLKEWGYDGVEIPIFDMTAARYQRLGKTLDKLGLERTSVTVSAGDSNPISGSADVRPAAVDRLEKSVDMSAALGATHLCGPDHSAIGEFSGKGPTPDEWKHGQDVLAQVADHAKQAGITLVLEYLNRFECYLLNCAADTARF